MANAILGLTCSWSWVFPTGAAALVVIDISAGKSQGKQRATSHCREGAKKHGGNCSRESASPAVEQPAGRRIHGAREPYMSRLIGKLPVFRSVAFARRDSTPARMYEQPLRRECLLRKRLQDSPEAPFVHWLGRMILSPVRMSLAAPIGCAVAPACLGLCTLLPVTPQWPRRSNALQCRGEASEGAGERRRTEQPGSTRGPERSRARPTHKGR